MKTIKQHYTIKAPAERVFRALTSVDDIKEWSGQGTSFEAREGGSYTMWDDWLKGTVLEIDPPHTLSQTWEPGDWPPQKEKSVAIFTLTEKNGATDIDFEQTNVPDEQYKATEEGWRDFYLGAIKAYLEQRGG